MVCKVSLHDMCYLKQFPACFEKSAWFSKTGGRLFLDVCSPFLNGRLLVLKQAHAYFEKCSCLFEYWFAFFKQKPLCFKIGTHLVRISCLRVLNRRLFVSFRQAFVELESACFKSGSSLFINSWEFISYFQNRTKLKRNTNVKNKDQISRLN